MLGVENKGSPTQILAKLSQQKNLAISLEELKLSLKFLVKRRDSRIYLLDFKSNIFPNGLILKTALNQKRVSIWEPSNESARLRLLSEFGPKNRHYFYINTILVSENPHAIVLPYFPSTTLRKLLDSKNSTNIIVKQATNSCFLAGEWLGELYSQSPKQRLAKGCRTKQSINKRILELEKYSHIKHFANLHTYIDILTLDIAKASARHPENFHGDFNQDNILVHEDGRICFIDPEPIRVGLFADFCHFRQSMLVFTRRGSKISSCANNSAPARAFCEGFENNYSDHNIVASAYLQNVIEKVAWYHKQGHIKSLHFTPRSIIHWYDQQRLMRYWLQWLTKVPRDPNKLWQYIKSTL